ncbi:MAG TPA: hypothetical protein VF144_22195 [Chitinophagaceae bacterium]
MKKIIFPVFILMVIMPSCVTSLRPLTTYNTAIIDDRIIGTWNSDEQEYTVQKFSESAIYKQLIKELPDTRKAKDQIRTKKEMQDSILYSKSYLIKYKKNKLEYFLFGNLIKLNGQLFMNFTSVDIQPLDSNDDISDAYIDCINTHSIARVQFANSKNIRLDFIDGDFLYRQVKAGRIKIKNETDEMYDTFVITASTNDLQQFILKYGNDDRFFNKENSVTLNRKS